MSEIVNGDNCLQLVLQNSELILDENEMNTEELSDIIYPNGTRAILVNEHYIQPEGTVILQEDLSPLYVEGDNGQLLLAGNQEITPEDDVDESKIIEFVDVDNHSSYVEEPQIVYITENSLLTQDDSVSQFQIAENTDYNDLVETQIVDLEEFMKGSKENVFEYFDENRFQYAVLKDGKLLTPSQNEEFTPIGSEDSQSHTNLSSPDISNNEEVLDISLITGKNLLTGQKVTLHGYMDKIQRQLKNGITPSSNTHKRKTPPSDIQGLLNKKLNIGVTSEGKKLVGKIIKVTKGNNTDDSEIDQNTSVGTKNYEKESSGKAESGQSTINDFQIVQANQPLTLVEEETVSESGIKIFTKDSFQPVTKTLEGLMAVENIRAKLENKNIVVKIVERNKKREKNVYVTKGCMEASVIMNSDGISSTHWNFVPSTEKKKKSEWTHVTLLITYLKQNERIIRVLLNPVNTKYVCSKCPRVFKSRLQLRIHKNSVHKILSPKLKDIKLSEKCTSSHLMMDESEPVAEFVPGGLDKIYYQCSVCFNNFVNSHILTEHLKVTHNIDNSYMCNQCGKWYVSHLHKKEHVSLVKYYECDVCKRTFTRYSNLQRHVAIHRGAEQMFKCSICGSSYHYVSSLTKHMVQNHIQTDLQKKN